MRGTISLLAAVAAAATALPAPAPARTHSAAHSQRLVLRARRGDRAARASLVEQHMGLVRAIAFRYRGLGLPVDDLVQEGAIGLLTAIDDYDPAHGTSFSTHAFWRVRAAVTHAVTARGSLVRIPRPVRERRRRVSAERDRLPAASVRELAVATGLSTEEIAEALAPTAVASLDSDAPGPADPDTQPEAAAIAREQQRALRTALRRLRPRQQAIVRRHFGIGLDPETLTAIAADLRLSPERTRALKDEALRELAGELDAA
jgi:RNA polymerase primary sigma factor